MTEPWICPQCGRQNETNIMRVDGIAWAECPMCEGFWKLKWDSKAGKFVWAGTDKRKVSLG